MPGGGILLMVVVVLETVTVMRQDGRQLEALVEFVERTLLPQGYGVKTNRRIYNDDGVQIAELDVEVRGKVGSTDFAWLIECRDRPSEGPAPGSWIEQLVGRRTRFLFNKVTAVSTTGFAPGAIEFARAQGIELREVKALAAEEFRDWLVMSYISQMDHGGTLRSAVIVLGESEGEERAQALRDSLPSLMATAFLKPSKGGVALTAPEAFSAAAHAAGTLYSDVVPNGPAKAIELRVRYGDENHFVVETGLGPVRVQSIIFRGELYIKETLLPLSATTEYRQIETGQPISQVAAFAPVELCGMRLSMELHRLAESGETHVTLRKLEDSDP